jgi:trimeric autotransporter adhesin
MELPVQFARPDALDFDPRLLVDVPAFRRAADENEVTIPNRRGKNKYMKRSLWQSRIASLIVSILLALGATAVQAAGAPTATTNAATAITQSGATLNGTITTNGASTTVIFERGLSSLYGSSGGPAPIPDNASPVAVAWPIGGLSCNTLYHFHVTANNGTGGTIDGGDLTFTTSACPAGTPSATTNAATAIAQTTATLNGTVTANGTTTTVGFEYGLTSLYGTGIAATQNPLAGNASGAAVSQTITGLSCNTLYHFHVFADNGTGGTQFGADLTFTTSACSASAPTATTTAATAITQTGATLNGTVTANGASTTVTFGYGLTSAYGTSIAATQSPLTGSASGAAVSVPITGLSCNTLYHFHVTSNNGTGGTIDGGDLTFTTSACSASAPSAIPTLSGAALLWLGVLLAALGFGILRAPRA